MSKKFKWDTDRIAIVFLTIVFAIMFRLMTHTWMRIQDFNLSAVLSPFFGLLMSQYVIEKKVDWREASLFFVMFIIIVNVINFFPAISAFDLFAIQMNKTMGVVFSAGIYLVAIPVSVIVSDWVTDMKKKK